MLIFFCIYIELSKNNIGNCYNITVLTVSFVKNKYYTKLNDVLNKQNKSHSDIIKTCGFILFIVTNYGHFFNIRAVKFKSLYSETGTIAALSRTE